MHVGNNSSSEARDYVIEQEQHSRVENKPPQSLQEPGDSGGGQAPAPWRHLRYTSAEVCHPVVGAADPHFRVPQPARPHIAHVFIQVQASGLADQAEDLGT